VSAVAVAAPADRLHLLDVNVLVALAWPNHVHHGRVVAWFDLWQGGWATTPITELGLVRLSLNPSVAPTRPSAGDVLDLLTQFRQHPRHQFIPDDGSLAAPGIALDRLAAWGQVTDLHLVNLAARHGAVLATLDRAIVDFLEPADRDHVVVLA
jgi:toxin-antitoxin system PIN domain toxin